MSSSNTSSKYESKSPIVKTKHKEEKAFLPISEMKTTQHQGEAEIMRDKKGIPFIVKDNLFKTAT